MKVTTYEIKEMLSQVVFDMTLIEHSSEAYAALAVRVLACGEALKEIALQIEKEEVAKLSNPTGGRDK